LEGGAARSRDGNLHTESDLPEQTAVDGLGRTDTFLITASHAQKDPNPFLLSF
jgi:hypothetical protein